VAVVLVVLLAQTQAEAHRVLILHMHQVVAEQEHFLQQTQLLVVLAVVVLVIHQVLLVMLEDIHQ
jgi:heme/copper-type cytochrome/quinol oxidase subunit 4